MMEILCLSLNHRVTSLEARERVAFSPEDGMKFLRALHRRLPGGEVNLLSTCNRTEIYVAHDGIDEADLVLGHLDLLREHGGFRPTEAPRNYEVLGDAEAVRHLYRVAGGMESQILGESQILAQVKEALEWGRGAGTVGRTIHRLLAPLRSMLSRMIRPPGRTS